MQAIVQDRYGSAEVLEPRDSRSPRSGTTRSWSASSAASIHVGDLVLMTGSPYVMRMATGLRKPKHRFPGPTSPARSRRSART